ncbi:penicillin-binding transpeptidase domain-containing protein, partial [Nonomuraea sp. NPDC005983]|uniref:penicillin-binding transpeptidase domain-containing protein n=1 Tax=Nonomuraea sp. NPDC005983 TaxID=3155595 RepID=UPI0033BBF262
MAGPRAKRINIPLRQVARLCAVMLFAVLVNATYLQGFKAPSLNADPRNQRTLIGRFDHPRGDILTYDGTTIARSLRTSGPYAYVRTYLGGEMYAPVTGYDSLYRTTGVEQAQDAALLGDDPRVRVRSMVTDGTVRGADVRLTISDRVQWAAYQGLKASGRPGAVVAVNPATGAILAMASYPSYDPNAFTTLDPKALTQVDARLSRDPSRPLVNRAIDQTYPPGAAFEIVTAAAALTSGEYAPTTRLDAPAALPLPGADDRLWTPDGRPCGSGHPSLAAAFRLSCDTAFASVGLQLGQDTIREQAEAFAFNDDLRIPLEVAPSTYPANTLDRPQTAMSAIGWHDDSVTPLMTAMMSAAVANDGVLMRPYLVEEVRLVDGSIINRADPTPYRTVLRPDQAGQLAAMMSAGVSPAWAGASAAAPGMAVAARAATTEDGDTLVTAFAPAGAPQVAVAVVLEMGLAV